MAAEPQDPQESPASSKREFHTVRITNINRDLEVIDIYEIFTLFGEITELSVYYDHTGTFNGTVKVNYTQSCSADEVFEMICANEESRDLEVQLIITIGGDAQEYIGNVCTVQVFNIHKSMCVSEIYQLFGVFGNIEETRMQYDNTGEFNGFIDVTYTTQTSANTAFEMIKCSGKFVGLQTKLTAHAETTQKTTCSSNYENLCTVELRNLDKDFNIDQLYEMFGIFGDIREMLVLYDSRAKFSGIVDITYDRRQSAYVAFEMITLGGYLVEVDIKFKVTDPERYKESENFHVLQLSNLHEDLEVCDMYRMFDSLGDVKEMAVHYDRKGKFNGSVDVTYTQQRSANKVYETITFGGNPIGLKVKFMAMEASCSTNYDDFFTVRLCDLNKHNDILKVIDIYSMFDVFGDIKTMSVEHDHRGHFNGTVDITYMKPISANVAFRMINLGGYLVGIRVNFIMLEAESYQKANDFCTVQLSNLHEDVDVCHIYAMMNAFGDVRKTSVKYDHRRKFNGIVDVTFMQQKSANKAVELITFAGRVYGVEIKFITMQTSFRRISENFQERVNSNCGDPCTVRLTNLYKDLDVNDIYEMFVAFGDIKGTRVYYENGGEFCKFNGTVDIIYKHRSSANKVFEIVSASGYLLGIKITCTIVEGDAQESSECGGSNTLRLTNLQKDLNISGIYKIFHLLGYISEIIVCYDHSEKFTGTVDITFDYTRRLSSGNALGMKEGAVSSQEAPRLNDDDLCTLQLANLAKDLNVDDVWKLFGIFGDIREVNVHYDQEAKFNGTVDITYSEAKSASNAFEIINPGGYLVNIDIKFITEGASCQVKSNHVDFCTVRLYNIDIGLDVNDIFYSYKTFGHIKEAGLHYDHRSAFNGTIEITYAEEDSARNALKKMTEEAVNSQESSRLNGDDECTLQLANLPKKHNLDELFELFEVFGDIREINVHYDQEVQFNGTVDITYSKAKSASTAFETINLGEHLVNVSIRFITKGAYFRVKSDSNHVDFCTVRLYNVDIGNNVKDMFDICKSFGDVREVGLHYDHTRVFNGTTEITYVEDKFARNALKEITKRAVRSQVLSSLSSDDDCTLQLANLPKNHTVESICELFDVFGDIREINVHYDLAAKFNGSVDITYTEAKSASTAFEIINLGGYLVNINIKFTTEDASCQLNNSEPAGLWKVRFFNVANADNVTSIINMSKIFGDIMEAVIHYDRGKVFNGTFDVTYVEEQSARNAFAQFTEETVSSQEPPSLNSGDLCTLQLANLPKSHNVDAIYDSLEVFGEIREVNIRYDESGKFSGTVDITYKETQSASTAFEVINLGGYLVDVSIKFIIEDASCQVKSKSNHVDFCTVRLYNVDVGHSLTDVVSLFKTFGDIRKAALHYDYRRAFNGTVEVTYVEEECAHEAFIAIDLEGSAETLN